VINETTILASGPDNDLHGGHLPAYDAGGSGDHPDVDGDRFGAVSVGAGEPGNKSNARLKVVASRNDAAPNTRTNARTNARQMPGPTRRNSDGLNDQMPGQMPEVETLSADAEFDQASGWDDLWRIEKDGENRYRWRLRFTTDRRSRPGGRITPAIRRKIKRRPGKGRHGDSRRAAERFRRRAELIAERLRAGDQGRAFGKSDAAAGGGRPNTRAHDSDLEREQMPAVRELDKWPEVPNLLM
jgi:hypothetical protein